jgi:hypothetical protein
MQSIHSSIVFFHIIAGGISLILFWIPCLTRKGGVAHRKYGGLYFKTMAFTSISGVVSSCIALAFPLVIYPVIPDDYASVGHYIAVVRGQYIFLLMLSLLVWSNIHHAQRVLAVKADNKALRKPLDIGLPIVLLVIASIALYQGIKYEVILTRIFAPIALFNAVSILRYTFARSVLQGKWLLEHISHTIASGIGAYTAFFAFGGRALFEGLGVMQLITWVIPGLIGTVFTLLLTRKYRSKMKIRSRV